MSDTVVGASSPGSEPAVEIKKTQGGKSATKSNKQAVKPVTKPVVKPEEPPTPKEEEKEAKQVKTMRIRITGRVEDAKGLITGDVDMDIPEARRLIRLGVAEAISR